MAQASVAARVGITAGEAEMFSEDTQTNKSTIVFFNRSFVLHSFLSCTTSTRNGSPRRMRLKISDEPSRSSTQKGKGLCVHPHRAAWLTGLSLTHPTAMEKSTRKSWATCFSSCAIKRKRCVLLFEKTKSPHLTAVFLCFLSRTVGYRRHDLGGG